MAIKLSKLTPMPADFDHSKYTLVELRRMEITADKEFSRVIRRALFDRDHERTHV